MEGKSKFTLVVLALFGGFVLFCSGWFLSRASYSEPYQVNTVRQPAAEESGSPEAEGEAARPDSLLPGETIDVNTADIYDLQRLPGIGETRARDIIAYREKHGPFQTVDELMEVSGIGPGILEGLREYASGGRE